MKRGQIQATYKEEILCNEGGENLEEVAQRAGRCLNLGNNQGQVGQGLELTDLIEDVPVHGRGGTR